MQLICELASDGYFNRRGRGERRFIRPSAIYLPPGMRFGNAGDEFFVFQGHRLGEVSADNLNRRCRTSDINLGGEERRIAEDVMRPKNVLHLGEIRLVKVSAFAGGLEIDSPHVDIEGVLLRIDDQISAEASQYAVHLVADVGAYCYHCR